MTIYSLWIFVFYLRSTHRFQKTISILFWYRWCCAILLCQALIMRVHMFVYSFCAKEFILSGSIQCASALCTNTEIFLCFFFSSSSLFGNEKTNLLISLLRVFMYVVLKVHNKLYSMLCYEQKYGFLSFHQVSFSLFIACTFIEASCM